MRFLYVMSGWEGSASDATVLGDALSKEFSVPEGISNIFLYIISYY
jgi:hypothetical protein